MKLVIANKNYSSWSMRGWLAVRKAGLPFEEIVVPLRQEDTRERLFAYSPSGLAPALIDQQITIWDSLAILEYAAERAPGAGLWPAAPEARAIARSVAAEMHSGFRALRTHMPMNIRARKPGVGRNDEVNRDVSRIVAIWNDCRQRFSADGPFLCGAFCGADVAFAPVITRFITYDVLLDPVSAGYAEAILADPDVADWCQAAAGEPWTIQDFEVN